MDIRDYITLVRRWFWLILIGVIAGGLTAFVASWAQTPYYRATSTLLISEGGGGITNLDINALRASEVLALSYVERLSNLEVLEEAAHNLGLGINAQELQENVDVRLVGQTQLVNLRVDHSDPEMAAKLANEIPLVFAKRNRDQQLARFADTKDSLSVELSAIDGEIQSAENDLTALLEQRVDQADINQANADLLRLRETYGSLLKRYEDVRIAEAGSLNTIIIDEHARVPETPVRPRALANTLLAAVIGGLAGLGTAFLFEYLDNTVQSAEQVFTDTGLSTLGAINVIKNGQGETDHLIARTNPRAPISEAFRVIRTNLDFVAMDGWRSLLITSPSPSEGKSTVCANLAIVMAQADKRVIILDADLRRPVQHQLFGLSNSRGLTAAIMDGERPAYTYLQSTDVEGLSVLPSGVIPPYPAEMLNSQPMAQVIFELIEACDTLIVDSPPTLPLADAAILATKVNGCLLVVQASKTRRAALIEANSTLQVSNTKLYGVVLNQVKNGPANNYEYHYHDSPQEVSGNGRYIGAGALGNRPTRGRVFWKIRPRRVRP
jgi:non-specific protein-tyrosine kinase